ncbi:class I SAM-dependent methyltransferase [Paenibacillus tarimensis]
MYHWIVRPKWLTQKYIHSHIKNHFPLENKIILDFGSGTGANCGISNPEYYLGIEPNLERVNLAKMLYPGYRFKVFDADTGRIPAENDSVDYIFIVAVLHHIPDDPIKDYLLEFERVLKPGGKVIVMEPCLCEKKKFSNWFMNRFDDGKYIRNGESYLNLFQAGRFECQVLKRFKKCFIYNEILFDARPIIKAEETILPV